MAKSKPPVESDVTPAFGEAFGGSADARTPPVVPVDHPDDNEPEADWFPTKTEREETELEALRRENAALKAKVAASATLYPEGKKYRVSLKDGPTCVVAPRPGEHPADCFRRLGHVISSIHQPEIGEAGTDERVGTYLPDGSVRPFADS